MAPLNLEFTEATNYLQLLNCVTKPKFAPSIVLEFLCAIQRNAANLYQICLALACFNEMQLVLQKIRTITNQCKIVTVNSCNTNTIFKPLLKTHLFHIS